MTGPQDEEATAGWHRRFAAQANNRAWDLAEQPELTGGEHRELLYAAYAAAYHWSQVGTPQQRAHAELLVGHVHARLGHGELALQFARPAFEVLAGAAGTDWEVAFAHAVMAEAAAAAGDRRLHAEHYATARRLGDGLESDDRDIFMATFRRIPAPDGV